MSTEKRDQIFNQLKYFLQLTQSFFFFSSVQTRGMLRIRSSGQSGETIRKKTDSDWSVCITGLTGWFIGYPINPLYHRLNGSSDIRSIRTKKKTRETLITFPESNKQKVKRIYHYSFTFLSVRLPPFAKKRRKTLITFPSK
jgi:hypothetical protein